jgi:hypothetical protein
MKNSLKGLMAAGLLICALVAQAAPTPFKTTYDELLDELPNVKAQMKDGESAREGYLRKEGLIDIGSAQFQLVAEGRTMTALDALVMVLIISPATDGADANKADQVANLFVRKMAKADAAYWQAKMFFEQEAARQISVLKAGGVPKSTEMVKGKTRLSTHVFRDGDRIAILYSLARID